MINLGQFLLSLIGGVIGGLLHEFWKSRRGVEVHVPALIRHSMDDQEFRDLVGGKKVTLKIDKRIFPNAPIVVVALQDIGFDRMHDAIEEAEQA